MSTISLYREYCPRCEQLSGIKESKKRLNINSLLILSKWEQTYRCTNCKNVFTEDLWLFRWED